MDQALYFPYMRVPKTPWFMQVLLYWDKVATIIPLSMRDDLTNTEPFMRELRDVGLLHGINPDRDNIRDLDHASFEGGFLALVDGRQPPLTTDRTRLHSGKMDWSLFSKLQYLGLADPPDDTASWWSVETRTAETYMAYLAAAISAANPGTTPVTDASSSMATLGNPHLAFKEQLAALRYSVITDALPAPSATVSPRELVAFKERHGEALTRCRRFLDNRLVDLVAVDDPEERQIRAAAISQEISDDVARLTEAMKRRRWPKISLVGFGGLVAAGLGGMEGMLGSGSALEFGIAAGKGALVVGAAGYELSRLQGENLFDSRAPLAYAALSARL